MDGDTGWSAMHVEQAGGATSRDAAPELADLRRYGRRVVRRFVTTARADERPTFARIIRAHLGVDTQDLPLLAERWASYAHPNVQAALDAWSAEPGRSVEVVGMTNYRHRGPFGLSDLIAPAEDNFHHGPMPGNVSTVRRQTGPDGESIVCLRAAVLLATRGDERVALLYRGSDRESDMYGVTVEVVAASSEVAARTTTELRDLALEHNVFRGQVVSFGRTM